jgi:site-specific DNA recombinase
MPPQIAALPDQPIAAIGYIRVSHAREEMISPDIQRRAITDWARRMNREIIGWIEDLDVTGRNFRRKVMKGIERIERKEAQEIAAYRYDRWGRNGLDSLANIARVEQAGGRVQSATEPFDPETAIGKYSRHNAVGLAELQSNLIGENWRAAHANRLARGLPSASTPRYGYILKGRVRDPLNPKLRRLDPNDPEGERYEPDIEGGTAAILVDLYRRYVAGEGSATIVGWLNGWQYRNARGSSWSYPGLFDVLDSGFAAGLLRIHNPDCRSCANVSACRNRIYIPGAQQPLIGPDLWEDYLQRRRKAARTPPRTLNPKYPLTGLCVCGHCWGASIHSGTRAGPGTQFRCGRYANFGECRGLYIRRAFVEDEVRKELKRWAADIDSRAAVTKSRLAAKAVAEADRTRLDNELVKIDAALARLATQKAIDGDRMPDGVYEQSRDQLLARRAELDASLAQVADLTQQTAVDCVPIILGLLAEWDVLPVLSKREVLAKLIRHVILSRPVPGGPAKVEIVPIWENCERPCCVTPEDAALER